jgi:hypothetical protein
MLPISQAQMLLIMWLKTTDCPIDSQTQYAAQRATQLAAQHIMPPIMPLKTTYCP